MSHLKTLSLLFILCFAACLSCGKGADKTEEGATVETPPARSFANNQQASPSPTQTTETAPPNTNDETTTNQVAGEGVSPDNNPSPTDELDAGSPTLANTPAAGDNEPTTISTPDLGGEITQSNTAPISPTSQVVNQSALNELQKSWEPLLTNEVLQVETPPLKLTAYQDLSFLAYLEDLHLFKHYAQQKANTAPQEDVASSLMDNVRSKISTERPTSKTNAYPLVRPYHYFNGMEYTNERNPAYLPVIAGDLGVTRASGIGDSQFNLLVGLYDKSMLALVDAPKHKNPVNLEETGGFWHPLYSSGELFIKLMLEETVKLVNAERGEKSRGTNELHPFAGEFFTGEVDRALPKLLSTPLPPTAISRITESRDRCRQEEQEYQRRKTELATAVRRDKRNLSSAEYAYFEKCQNSLNYMATSWRKTAEQLDALLAVSSQEKTYALVLETIEIIDGIDDLLLANPNAKRASTMLWDIRTDYYQKVRQAEVAFN